MVVEQLMYSPEMKVFSNHVYELSKGVRHLVLYTIPKKFEDITTRRLQSQGIDYIIQEVSGDKINLFFGKKECIKAIKLIATRPLNQLSPEEDFILGTLLGYDVCAQCTRYSKMKESN
ncbi:MAG: DUF2023 family protein [Rikenellaceae bacterium]